MAAGSEIVKAFRRVSVLKSIVAAERSRAEANPTDARNVNLGIVASDLSRAEAKQSIDETFSEIEWLLDHLNIAHMAAAFELEAKSKISNAIGTAKNAITKDKKSSSSWHERLVRGADTYEGLRDIEQLIAPPADALKELTLIRSARNKFSHGVRLKDLSTIDPVEALHRLIEALASLR